MKMKSNQRREAEQLDRSQFLRFPLRKLVRIQEEDGNGSLASMSDNLLSQSSNLNEQQVLMRSKTMNRLGANSEYCAINSNKETKSSSSSSLNLHHTKRSNIINNKNLDYSNKSTMYNIITSRSEDKRSDKQQRASVNRLARCQARLQATSAARILLNGSLSSRIHRQTLTFVVISLALTSCILINQIQAYSTPSDTAAESPQASGSQSSSASQSSSSSSSSDSSPVHSLASSVASSALSSLSSAIISAAFQDGKSSSSDRSNSLPLSANSGGPEVAPSPTLSAGSSSSSLLSSALSSSSSSSSSSSASAPTSIAASLSSAVASAAAAAAVAAAQNSLSGGDARSLLTSSSNKQQTRNHNHLNHHHQNSRNTGLNLALKLADAIPEVPYNILHNMKKLDHAAPFYNVGNKESYSGNSKESSHGLLASALHASGSFGGAAEQLSHLFRSPIWKRIADGYGEFTSEFRSLFRAPSTTMKGPTNPTTKLLRDISVPALLMILASTIPGDWRPVRTRRKSLIPSDLVPAYPLVDPMMASASSELPTSYSPTPRLYGSMPNFNMALQQQQLQMNPLAQMYNQLDQSAAASSSSSQARTNDINLQQQQPADAAGVGSASTVAWFQPQTVAQHSELTSPNQMNNYDTQLHQIQLQQHPQQIHHQQQQQQPSIKRFGDSLLSALSLNPANGDSTKSQVIHSDLKPVNGDRLYSNNNNNNNNLASASNPLQSSAGSLFSSLTSSLANQVGQSKLMSRIRNANVAGSGSGSSSGNANLVSQPSASNSQQHRVASGSLMNNEQHKMSSSYPPVSRDNLDDRHRYSLVDNNNDNSMLYFGKYMNEKQQQKSSPPTKPFLLSAMTQALGSMLANSPSLDAGNSDAIISRKMFTLNGNNNPFLVADKAALNHHQHDSILRRNHQVTSGIAMEQRELSKLIPQSWREVVKRTVNSVQEQATTQWRSIEGQLVNWVQDKLKTLPVGAAAASSGSASSPPTVVASSPAPVANIFASVGSTALNMLGLGGRTQASNATTAAAAVAPTNNESSVTDEASQATTPVLKNKNDSTSKPKQPIAKGALAGVANMIVNTLANRQSPSPSASSSSSTTVLKPKSSIASDETSSSGNLVSQYPTLTGIQVAQSPSSPSVDLGSSASSIASGTGSTISLMAA